jgi:hypothetical protein
VRSKVESVKGKIQGTEILEKGSKSKIIPSPLAGEG